MRIGTWNVDNRIFSDLHKQLILSQECDVWLLTEVNPKWIDRSKKTVLHFHCHHSSGVMGRGQYWAAILSLVPMKPMPDPHPASAAAQVDGLVFCSTILPWRGVKTNSPPWNGANHSEMTEKALEELLVHLKSYGSDFVWGGDWNHELQGREYSGSMGGRKHLLKIIEQLGLTVPTRELPHRTEYRDSIDHISVPSTWQVTSAQRIDATGLSDHDAYVVEVHRRESSHH